MASREIRLPHRFVKILTAAFVAIVLAPLAKAATDDQIAERLKALMDKAPKGAQAGVLVERASDRKPVYLHDPAMPLAPASNMKILTTAAAMEVLGQGFQYRTELKCRGTIEDGALKGDLVVVGAGDPTISARFQDNPQDVTHVFRDWAADLKKRRIRRVTGAVIGDDDAFDDVAAAPGWPEQQAAEWYCAEVSALVFNDGCVDVTWTGDKSEGAAASPSLNPQTSYLTLVNDVQSRKDKKLWVRRYDRDGQGNTVTCHGAVGPGKTAVDSVSVSGATLYFATVFRDTLIAEGIKVDGLARDLDDLGDKSPYRQGLKQLAAYDSPPLEDIVFEANQHSQNLFAELLLKTIGRKQSGEGSFASGTRAVLKFLEANGVPTEGLNLVDGSGLSHDDRVTAQALIGALRAADAAPWRDAYRASFPIGGKTGTLSRRFKQAPIKATPATKTPSSKSPASKSPAKSKKKTDDPARRIIAKTGTIKGVRALSGWASQPDGTEYRFSILLNNDPGGVTGGVHWIDSMALAIAEK